MIGLPLADGGIEQFVASAMCLHNHHDLGIEAIHAESLVLVHEGLAEPWRDLRPGERQNLGPGDRAQSRRQAQAAFFMVSARML